MVINIKTKETTLLFKDIPWFLVDFFLCIKDSNLKRQTLENAYFRMCCFWNSRYILHNILYKISITM